MSQRILVVDQVLTTLPDALPTEKSEAYALSMVFANAAARAARNGGGPAAGTADAFRRTWMNTLGKIGWVIQQASSGSVTTQTSGVGVSIMERLGQQGGDDLAQSINTFRQMIGSGDDSALTEMWWNAARSDDFLQAGFGTVRDGDAALTFAMTNWTVGLGKLEVLGTGFFGHDKAVEVKEPADLFEPLDPATIDLSASSVTATLDMTTFQSKQDEIHKLLGDKFAEHFTAAPALRF